MTWHLKDKELEKQLIAIDPNFVKTLTESVEENLNQPNDWFNDESLTEVELTYNGEFFGTAFFYTHELEEVLDDYNPNDWNNYPEVIPPYDKHMCLEFFDKDNGRTCRYAAYYTSSGWRSSVENGLPKYVLFDSLIKKGSVTDVRFRPWED